jgi:pimeloyl-ACP methyl ester carboxylesterase
MSHFGGTVTSVSKIPAATDEVTTFYSVDGLRLTGSILLPSASSSITVLVHGGGANRNEGGFFTRLAAGLAQAGVASLRFDLRGHGDSEGRQEDLTLSGVVNDIRAAVEHARHRTGDAPVNVLGASFSGGLCGFYAAQFPAEIRRLVLLNPLINYKKRFIDDKPYWTDGHIDLAAGRDLAEHGFLNHSPTFKLGRPLLNEVFYLRPDEALSSIVTPTLVVHGTGDTFVPVESSRAAVNRIAGDARLLEIEGAQHGFAAHEDPQYVDPRTVEWQAFVVHAVADWLA